MMTRWQPWAIAVLLLLIGMGTILEAGEVISEEIGEDDSNPDLSGRTNFEMLLSLAVLGFGLIVFTLEVLVVLKSSRAWDTHSVRLLGLTLSIVAGVFLVTAGYSQQQIAPMVGLLGTIVGFLLGQTESRRGANTRE
jgi:hypothetical protein